MAGETGAQDGANQARDKNLDWPGHIGERTKDLINRISSDASRKQMSEDQRIVGEGVAAVTKHLESPASEGSEATLGKGNITEMYRDQEAADEGVAALAKLLAEVPGMPATITSDSGETSYPLLDSLAARWGGDSLRAILRKPGTGLEDDTSSKPDILTNSSRSEGMHLGGMFSGGDAIRSMVPGPSKSMEEHFPAAGKSEQEAYEELVRIANTDVIKSVTDYKTGKLGDLPTDETKWTKSQVDEIKVAAMLRGLANQDVLGDGPFAKMVGGVAKAARTVREGARSVGSKIGGLRDLAGRSGGTGGEPPAGSPPGGTPPATL